MLCVSVLRNFEKHTLHHNSFRFISTMKSFVSYHAKVVSIRNSWKKPNPTRLSILKVLRMPLKKDHQVVNSRASAVQLIVQQATASHKIFSTLLVQYSSVFARVASFYRASCFRVSQTTDYFSY